MKLSLLAALFVSAVSIAAPVDSTDSMAITRSATEGDDASHPIVERADHTWKSATPELFRASVRIYFTPDFYSDKYNVEEFVKYTRDSLRDYFPNANIFIYHRFKKNPRFKWQVSDPSPEEGELYKLVNGKHEYYKVVVFHSDGHLFKSGDGGFANWAYAGKYHREGDNVYFEAP